MTNMQSIQRAANAHGFAVFRAVFLLTALATALGCSTSRRDVGRVQSQIGNSQTLIHPEVPPGTVVQSTAPAVVPVPAVGIAPAAAVPPPGLVQAPSAVARRSPCPKPCLLPLPCL
ncbi:MAG: hypothetical protein U1D30_13135 [Planctomycetota bacterium]